MIEFLTDAWTLIQSVLEFLLPVLPHIGRVVMALLISWGATQGLKYIWRFVKIWLPPYNGRLKIIERFTVQVLAVVLCFIPLYQTWEGPYPFWVSVCFSLLSPVIYSGGMKLAYQRWPALEGLFSLNPSVRVDRDEAGKIVGVKYGNDDTEILR